MSHSVMTHHNIVQYIFYKFQLLKLVKLLILVELLKLVKLLKLVNVNNVLLIRQIVIEKMYKLYRNDLFYFCKEL